MLPKSLPPPPVSVEAAGVELIGSLVTSPRPPVEAGAEDSVEVVVVVVVVSVEAVGADDDSVVVVVVAVSVVVVAGCELNGSLVAPPRLELSVCVKFPPN